MRAIAASESNEELGRLISAAEREPVVIRHGDRDAAVLLSPMEYQTLRRHLVDALDRFCDEVGKRAEARGLTDAKLAEILAEKEDK